MHMQLYSVYDAKTGEYLPPFCAPNDSVARRTFESAIMREDHDFHVHAEDYSLWGIANYDTEKAFIDTHVLEPVAQAHEILANLETREDRS